MYEIFRHLHETIVRETVDRVTDLEAVALAGILHSYRVVVRQEAFPAAFYGFDPESSIVEALTLDEAIRTVAYQTGYPFEALATRFESLWVEIRDSEITERLKTALARHRLVYFLEPY